MDGFCIRQKVIMAHRPPMWSQLLPMNLAAVVRLHYVVTIKRWQSSGIAAIKASSHCNKKRLKTIYAIASANKRDPDPERQWQLGPTNKGCGMV